MNAPRSTMDRGRNGGCPTGRRSKPDRRYNPAKGDRMTAIGDTVTYLEMFERPPPISAPPPLGKLALMRAEACTVSFYRYLYETVGTPWIWFERREWSDAALAAELAKPTTEIFVLHVGGVPAGFFELDAAAARETELSYFGLAPE